MLGQAFTRREQSSAISWLQHSCLISLIRVPTEAAMWLAGMMMMMMMMQAALSEGSEQHTCMSRPSEDVSKRSSALSSSSAPSCALARDIKLPSNARLAEYPAQLEYLCITGKGLASAQ